MIGMYTIAMKKVNKILQIKTALVIDNCAVYLYINNIKTRGY